MFAYCNNNPVVRSDQFGSFSAKATTVMQLSGNGTLYIVNQNDKPYGEKEFGITNVAHSGCGPVAAYNVLKIMGASPSLDAIIEFYEQSGSMFLGGIIGTSPYTCAEYLNSEGYSTFLTTDVYTYSGMAESADACILWYWFDSEGFPSIGAHFVAYSQKNGVGTYYNVYRNSTSFHTFHGGCDSFLDRNNGYSPVLILVYD